MVVAANGTPLRRTDWGATPDEVVIKEQAIERSDSAFVYRGRLKLHTQGGYDAGSQREMINGLVAEMIRAAGGDVDPRLPGLPAFTPDRRITVTIRVE